MAKVTDFSERPSRSLSPGALLLRQNTFWVKSKRNEVIQAAAKATQNGGLWDLVTRANADKIMY